jgi:hypothetical protein
MSDMQWFVQGECNCKRCVDERKLSASDSVLKALTDVIPFLPTNFDPGAGFGGIKTASGEELESRINTLLKDNVKREIAFMEAGDSKSQLRYCSDCGRLHVREPTYKITVKRKVRYLCDICFDARYYKCFHCGDVQPRGIERLIHDEEYCLKCANEIFTRCNWCGNYFDNDELSNLDNYPQFTASTMVCEDCFANNLEHCSVCDELYDRSNLVERDDQIMCQNCEEEHRPIHSWRYKPKPKYQLMKGEGNYRTDTLLYGVEVELELFSKKKNEGNREWVGKKVLDLMGKDVVYNKHDGSLKCGGDLGFEIVSHPFTWLEYRDKRKMWNACFEMLKGYDCKAEHSGRCGMHVHMNKRAFTTHQTYKFVDFIYNPAHLDFIIYISSRPEYGGNFQTYASLTGYKDMKKFAKDKTGRGHHTGVDLSPPNTNEVRIFNGTLNANLFHKNMEFCHALFHFTKANSRSENTVLDFAKFVSHKSRRGMYRNLHKFILAGTDVRHQYGLNKLFNRSN